MRGDRHNEGGRHNEGWPELSAMVLYLDSVK
jgi:hypothetical protein